MRWSTVPCTCVVLAACGLGSAAADPRLVADETRRLLAPYLVERQVGCDELVLEFTANFSPGVSRPAVDPVRHRFVRRQGPGYDELEWINLGADPATAFTVTVGASDLDAEIADARPQARRGTTFTVLRALQMKVFTDRRELTLRARASGGVFVLADGAPRDLEEFEIQDGVLKTR